MQEAVVAINAASEGGKLSELLRALQNDHAHLSDINPQNIRWYSEVLNRTRKQNAEVSGCGQWVWSVGVASVI